MATDTHDGILTLVTNNRSPRVKCNSTTRAGKPCTNWAVRGATKCQVHGRGTSVEIITHARLQLTRDLIVDRLQKLAEPALARLHAIITSDDARTQDQLRAIEIVMDRVVGRKLDVDTNAGDELDLDAEIAAALGEVQGSGDEDLEEDDDAEPVADPE